MNNSPHVMYCVVPVGIHALSMEGFFVLKPPNPPEILVLLHIFLYNFWLLRSPTPSEFLKTFHEVDVDNFCHCTFTIFAK